ncbi:MAG: hypothetical protein FJY56_00770 [Betaproteobacteria bacterium]|nr:hypothetical protein [Betaproteobacteria bacterium]
MRLLAACATTVLHFRHVRRCCDYAVPAIGKGNAALCAVLAVHGHGVKNGPLPDTAKASTGTRHKRCATCRLRLAALGADFRNVTYVFVLIDIFWSLY